MHTLTNLYQILKNSHKMQLYSNFLFFPSFLHICFLHLLYSKPIFQQVITFPPFYRVKYHEFSLVFLCENKLFSLLFICLHSRSSNECYPIHHHMQGRLLNMDCVKLSQLSLLLLVLDRRINQPITESYNLLLTK